MFERLDTMKRRILARKRSDWIIIGPALPLVAKANGEAPDCRLDAWLQARTSTKKPPLLLDRV